MAQAAKPFFAKTGFRTLIPEKEGKLRSVAVSIQPRLLLRSRVLELSPQWLSCIARQLRETPQVSTLNRKKEQSIRCLTDATGVFQTPGGTSSIARRSASSAWAPFSRGVFFPSFGFLLQVRQRWKSFSTHLIRDV